MFSQTYNDSWHFDDAISEDLFVDADNNQYIIGYSFGDFDADPGPNYVPFNAYSDGSGFLSKFDSSGNFVYIKRFPYSMSGFDVEGDPQGNVYITGIFSGYEDFDPGSGIFFMGSSSGGHDGYIVKLNSAGNFQWAKKMQATGIDSFGNLTFNSAGNIVMRANSWGTVSIPTNPATVITSSSNTMHTFIVTMSPSGVFLSAQHISSSQNNGPLTFVRTSTDDLIVASSYAAALSFNPELNASPIPLTEATYFFRYNFNGEIMWLKYFAGSPFIKQVLLDDNSNIYIILLIDQVIDVDPGAGTVQYDGETLEKSILVKFSPTGDYLWSKELPTGNIQSLYFSGRRSSARMALDNDQNIHLVSYFYGTQIFETANQTDTLQSGASPDIFYSKFNSNGDMLWKKTYGDYDPIDENNWGSVSTGIKITDDNRIYITGEIGGTVDMNAGSQTDMVTSSNSGKKTFIMRLDMLNLSTDFNIDGEIDVVDLNLLMNELGCTNCAIYDINQDGIITIQDVLLLINLFN